MLGGWELSETWAPPSKDRPSPAGRKMLRCNKARASHVTAHLAVRAMKPAGATSPQDQSAGGVYAQSRGQNRQRRPPYSHTCPGPSAGALAPQCPLPASSGNAA